MLLRRRIITRLLLLDHPADQRTDAELEAEVRQNYRWNVTVSILDGITFWFGIAFVSSATIVPLFVSKVSLNPLVIGLVAMLAQAGWHLPQLFSAGAIEQVPRKKPILVNLGFFLERVPVFLWPISALLCLWSPTAGLIMFVVTYAWHGFGAGIIAPAWQDLLARIIPIEGRGKVYGFTTFLGTGFAAGGALISGYLLDRYTYPYDFFLIFLIAAIAIFLSWLFLALTRETVAASGVTGPGYTPEKLWPRLTTILREDRNFRRFLIARALYTLGTMGLGFVTVSAVEILGIADQTVGFYTVVMLTGQTVGGLIAGILADRIGHKPALAIGSIATTFAFGLILIAPFATMYYVAFALAGFAIGVNIVSGMLIALEFAPLPQRRPTYVGISNSVLGVAGVAAPLLGGWLALVNYELVFVFSTALSAMGVVLILFWVHDPRYRPAPHQKASRHNSV